MLCRLAIALEGVGAVAVGINCWKDLTSWYPLSAISKRRIHSCHRQTNAGMPTIDDQGNAIYSMDAKSFAEHMKVLIENGASVVGGCCGRLRKLSETEAEASEDRFCIFDSHSQTNNEYSQPKQGTFLIRLEDMTQKRHNLG